MALAPFKVLPNLIVNGSILKYDENNVIFEVTGGVNGHVSSSVPYIGIFLGTSSYAQLAATASYFSGSIETASYANTALTATYAYTASSFEASLNTKLVNAYKRLRYKVTGNFDNNGNAIVVLPTSSLGSNAFTLPYFNDISIDILVQSGSSWVNEIIAYELKVSGSLNNELYVVMDAPDLDSAYKYKLVAVNENGELFNIV
jgi:hypothetical protein